MGFFLKAKTVFLSFFINFFNGDNYHNASKFFHIYKIWSNIKLDNINGDYIEFGVFKGKSLYHSLKTYQKLNINNSVDFIGLDSFEGFPENNHKFYKKENFSTNYIKVKKQFAKFNNVFLYKGFFKETLEKEELNQKSFAFVFIDCDIYESALEVFKYINNKVSLGGFVMIDDFTSIDENGNSIYKAFKEICDPEKYLYFNSYSNGQIYRRIK